MLPLLLQATPPPLAGHPALGAAPDSVASFRAVLAQMAALSVPHAPVIAESVAPASDPDDPAPADDPGLPAPSVTGGEPGGVAVPAVDPPSGPPTGFALAASLPPDDPATAPLPAAQGHRAPALAEPGAQSPGREMTVRNAWPVPPSDAPLRPESAQIAPLAASAPVVSARSEPALAALLPARPVPVAAPAVSTDRPAGALPGLEPAPQAAKPAIEPLPAPQRSGQAPAPSGALSPAVPVAPKGAESAPHGPGNGALVTAVLARLGQAAQRPQPVPPPAQGPLPPLPSPPALTAATGEEHPRRDLAGAAIPPASTGTPHAPTSTTGFPAGTESRAPLAEVSDPRVSDTSAGEKPLSIANLPEKPADSVPPQEARRADTPRHEAAEAARHAPAVARQVAEAIPPSDTGGFDLALDPEELGQVRLKLTSSEGGSLLLIQAERPETLDLMRRHVALLEQDLRALGHAGLTLQFSGGDGRATGGFGRPDPGQPQTATFADAQSDPPPTRPQGASGDHLDLRL